MFQEKLLQLCLILVRSRVRCVHRIRGDFCTGRIESKQDHYLVG